MQRRIINIIKKFLFTCFKIKAYTYNKFNKKNYKKRVALVSCDERKNNVKDDLYLKYYLNTNQVEVDIISWQDKTIDYTKYDLVVIRSIWNYQYHLKDFLNWLQFLESNNINLCNSIDVIRNNYDKFKQFEILKNNEIKIIDTEFLSIDKNISKKIKSLKFSNFEFLVTKPTISESSNNTYIVGKQNKNYKNFVNINDIANKYMDINANAKLMVQPFLEEVFDGEYSICCISGKITHAILRFNDVFNNSNKIKYIPVESLDQQIISIVEKVLSIKEYQSTLYSRIDLIKCDDWYLVMEVELLDPNMFISFLPRKTKAKVFQLFSSEIIKRI